MPTKLIACLVAWRLMRRRMGNASSSSLKFKHFGFWLVKK